MDQACLVGGCVVEHEVHVEVHGHRCLDLVQERPEFCRAVTSLAGSDHRASLHVQRGEQVRGAMALIVVAPSLNLAGTHRQNRGSALDGLDLRFLVKTQHQGALRRVEGEPDHIAHLVDEGRVAR